MSWKVFLNPRRAQRELTELHEELSETRRTGDENREELRLKLDYIKRLETENRAMTERIEANRKSLEDQRKTIDSLKIELNRLQRSDKAAERLREENKTLTERIAVMRGENRALKKRAERLEELLHARMGGKKIDTSVIRLTDDESSDLTDESDDWLLPMPRR